MYNDVTLYIMFSFTRQMHDAEPLLAIPHSGICDITNACDKCKSEGLTGAQGNLARGAHPSSCSASATAQKLGTPLRMTCSRREQASTGRNAQRVLEWTDTTGVHQWLERDAYVMTPDMMHVTTQLVSKRCVCTCKSQALECTYIIGVHQRLELRGEREGVGGEGRKLALVGL